MNAHLKERLNGMLPRLVSDTFLRGTELGGEINFHIFDYPPDEELEIRQHIRHLMEQLPKHHPDLRVRQIDLFDFVIAYLRERNVLDRALSLQREKGDRALLEALRAPLQPERLAQRLISVIQPAETDLVLIYGVGRIWPLLRAHTLLNNLHAAMGRTPLVLFYPGVYDGQSLKLFGKIGGANYYRAFKLTP